jgi:hypothetical protein
MLSVMPIPARYIYTFTWKFSTDFLFIYFIHKLEFHQIKKEPHSPLFFFFPSMSSLSDIQQNGTTEDDLLFEVDRPPVVVIEGNIAVGKTTLVGRPPETTQNGIGSSDVVYDLLDDRKPDKVCVFVPMQQPG